MKTFLNVCMGVIATLFVGIILWGTLYLAIPTIKDKTDELFKWNDYSVVEEEQEDENNPTGEPELDINNGSAVITI